MNNKKILVFLLIALMFVLSGCSAVETVENADDTLSDALGIDNVSANTDVSSYRLASTGDSEIYEFVDPGIGVHYLVYCDIYWNTGGITPRLNADGSVMVDEVDANN